MKKVLFILSVLLATISNAQKTFFDEFKQWDTKLFTAAVAAHNGSPDSTLLWEASEADRITLASKYNFASEVAKLRPIDLICSYIASIQYFNCTNYGWDTYTPRQCWTIYQFVMSHHCKAVEMTPSDVTKRPGK